jgi:small subunit ribosomal protein S1
MEILKANKDNEAMEHLVEKHQEMIDMPEMGEVVSGSIIDKARNAMYVDLGTIGVGVIYGRDLMDDQDTFKTSKLGDKIQATVRRYDNEDDMIELSLREATYERSWDEIQEKLESGEVFDTTIIDANKGGLIVRVVGVTGFLPVSQLAPDHYPRVEGGSKEKIFDRLKEYEGQQFSVKIIGADKQNEKLIVSEKAVVSDEMSDVLEDLKTGDEVEGVVSGVVDFGAFVKFSINKKDLEGLVHISELAWQRVDDPLDFVSIGDKIKAKIISVDGLRISLSMKQMKGDPWANVTKKFNVGDIVEGVVLKVTAFGGFVKLDDEIHGLIHISELTNIAKDDPASVLKVGDKKKFGIISLDPKEHRLGLTLSTKNIASKKKAGSTKKSKTTSVKKTKKVKTVSKKTKPIKKKSNKKTTSKTKPKKK